jgi:hypothetical protein
MAGLESRAVIDAAKEARYTGCLFMDWPVTVYMYYA